MNEPKNQPTYPGLSGLNLLRDVIPADVTELMLDYDLDSKRWTVARTDTCVVLCSYLNVAVAESDLTGSGFRQVHSGLETGFTAASTWCKAVDHA